MPDLMERTALITVTKAIEKIKPMVQMKAYIDVLTMLAMQPKGFGLDFATFDKEQLIELQDYNASRVDRLEMVTDMVHALTGLYDEVVYSELGKCFAQVVTEITKYAEQNSTQSFLDASISVCKSAISKDFTLELIDKKITKKESDFWGNSTTYNYSATGSCFDRSFNIDMQMIKSHDYRADVTATAVEDNKYGSIDYFFDKYLKEALEDYAYGWILMHSATKS